MKKYLLANKGFISVYFLSMMLYCISIIAIVMINDRRRALTALNIETAKQCFLVESAVINDIRCQIAHENLDESYGSASGISYRIEYNANTIYCNIDSDLVYALEITYDPITGRLFDYTSFRNVEAE